jgi:predicted enzyme related to lactoylglutathione lyase
MAATDIARSAAFYRTVFGWNIWTRGDGRARDYREDPGGNVLGLYQGPARP